MQSEWRKCSLEDADVILLDCVHKTPPDAGKGIPYIAIPQLKEGRIDFLASPRLISHEDYLEWTKKTNPQTNDIVLSRRCNPGETAYVSEGAKFALGQNLVLLRATGNTIFPPFLRWLVRGKEWWDEIAKYLNVGAVFDSLRCAEIPKFELTIPPISEQKAIAHILGSLDDKIELNRQMNATLEAMAQALFKSWFVDFDPVIDNALAAGNPIPDELADKAAAREALGDARKPLPEDIAALFPAAFVWTEEMGWIPEGWEVSPLKHLTTKIGSGATPTGGQKVYQDSGTALIRSQNIYDSEFVWAGLAYISDEAATQLQGVTVQSEDVLLNITGASILRTCVVNPNVLPARVNQHVAIIRAKKGISSWYLHLHLLQKRTKDYLLGLNAGGSREAVTKAHIESVPSLVPNNKILDSFHALIAPNYEKAHQLDNGTITLSRLRDTLLPKLLSGELRIPETEKLVEEAI
ncbi:MAG: restriction endonuclease subunit S [Gammaproteobacteria bacterium]|nr:restriction endonuclease subunit S [Gammaproteobacteria bacterium]MBU1724234.1 restriction endonuclease subunit S [Gammaproteobacteria bacterium]MBU2006338.1 restriction endonuclease subunit S [Gammaproteobacteria bacterium]